MEQMHALRGTIPTSKLCLAMEVSRASLHRFHHRQSGQLTAAVRTHHRALPKQQRAAILELLNSKRFSDVAPASAYAMLLDEGTRLCSVSTMYRILHENKSVRERRAQRHHVIYSKPQLLAVGPNEVWSWDITKLLGAQKWEYFHLYVMMDIYSRMVVGWMVCPNESGSLATRLIATSCRRQNILASQLSIHSDRGPAMTSRPVTDLLKAMDITKSLSRPYVSNDNPFSEAQFKTLKYRPGFPKRFGSLQDAKAFLRPFFEWYNYQHRHSSLGYLTPASVHDGSAQDIRGRRQAVLDAAYARHPERFVAGRPSAPKLPSAAWINPPAESGKSAQGPGQDQEVTTSSLL